MCKLTALLVVLHCYYLCLAEASTTFEDLALGGCQCKSCNCGGVTQECSLQHKRDIISFNELPLGECSCESCTCSNVLDTAECSENSENLNAGPKTYKNCKELFDSGNNESGVYKINVNNDTSFNVYCDMVTDGGGWTVFQRRKDGSINFYRNWIDYQNGFGDLDGEFWLGLDKIHLLTSSNTALRVDLRDSNGLKAYAQYSTFIVGNETSKYTLSISGYNGTAGDSLAYHNSMKFTTRDRDNDNYSGQCAHYRRGAWWYNTCSYSNLNGLYLSGQSSIHGVGWQTWKSHVSIPFTEMKIK